MGSNSSRSLNLLMKMFLRKILKIKHKTNFASAMYSSSEFIDDFRSRMITECAFVMPATRKRSKLKQQIISSLKAKFLYSTRPTYSRTRLVFHFHFKWKAVKLASDVFITINIFSDWQQLVIKYSNLDII